MNLPTIIPAKRRAGRRHKQSPTLVPVSTAPVLVSAAFFTDDGAYAILTFDRAVSVDGFDIESTVVLRHPSTELFEASSAELIDPTTVKVALVNTVNCDEGPDVVMNVAANNGIVAVEGGAEWAGATDVVLPFP